MNRTLARIEARHFVAGIVLRDAIVIEAAPIVCYMLGWGAWRVDRYCTQRGWNITGASVEA